MEQFDQYYDISRLVLKQLRGELNISEQEKLEKWLQESDHNRQLFRKLTDQDFINPELVRFSDSDKSAAWKNIEKATTQKNITPLKRDLRKLLKYAAVIAFLVISGVLLYQQKQSNKDEGYQRIAEHEIKPGGNKATLTLANGRKIALDDVKTGELARQQDAVITKTADGQIVYNAPRPDASFEKEVFNTVATPRGGQYQLILPDGSKVWLNSMSSIKFPAVFNGNERRVELSGEAYFEVSKNKEKPFIVDAAGVKVKVLGTKFNVSAYNDEKHVKTTLLEGSVKIATGKSSAILAPGMQAICEGENPVQVINTDVEEAVAWKNGYFLFRRKPIEDLMLTISRWYDIDVKYNGNMEGKIFGGKFSRGSNLSELLKSLELTGAIKFKIEGRRVTAMP